MPTIVLRREALLDFERIDKFSRENFGDSSADIYMADFNAALARLTEYPEIGSPFPHAKAPIRSIPVGRHRIFYYFDGRRVIVVRVLHQSQNAPGHISR